MSATDHRFPAQQFFPEDVPYPNQLQEICSGLFEWAPDAVIVTDQHGRIFELNREAERQLGYAREELAGESVEAVIPQRLRDIYRSAREDYQADPEHRPMHCDQEILAVCKDGSQVPVKISLIPVTQGRALFFYCVVRDIRERLATRRAARHLRFEEAVAGLSGKFINLPADQVDGEITKGLQVLTEALDADRATLGQVDLSAAGIVVTHAWARPGIPYFGDKVVKDVLPWLYEHIASGKAVFAETPEDLPVEASHEREYMKSVGIKSAVDVPFRVGGTVTGGFAIDSFREYQHWDDAILARIQDVADIFANALTRKRADEELKRAYNEVRQLKDELQRENHYLREETQLDCPHAGVVGSSAAMRSVLKKAEQVAATDSAVLILGETGTGKELIAQTIHQISNRNHRPMVKVNCAALPSTLIESELFGREKGAYTGALAREIGRFELADKSTIFLDEIGELPAELQSKLLRVLQEGEFERLGSSKTMRADVRVIAATCRNLSVMVKEGKFREDLFYRLNVFPIVIPPLRERSEDIPALVWHILKDLGKRMGRSIESVQGSTMRDLQRYSWPGNVRELRNVIERSLILHTSPVFRAELDGAQTSPAPLRRLNEVEGEHFRNVLHATHWRIRGPGGAAEVLGLKPTTLEARMKKLGIERPH